GGLAKDARERADGAVELVGGVHGAVGYVVHLGQLVVDVIERGRRLTQHRHDLGRRLLERRRGLPEQVAEPHEHVHEPDPGQHQEQGEGVSRDVRGVHDAPYYRAITPLPTTMSPSYSTAAWPGATP